jgi:AcrR family transcriptional regulator
VTSGYNAHPSSHRTTVPNELPRARTDTRNNLILSALALFAEHGIDAVSMRTINNAAGTRNASAVHYHFGSKLGIVEAVIQSITAELDTFRLDALSRLECRAAAGETPSCREILWAAFMPYYRLLRNAEHGRDALRFLARLQIDLSPDVQAILNREPHRIAARIDALLERALPRLPADIRRLRYIYFWTLVVHMFCASDLLATTGFGDLRAGTEEEGLQRLFDFLVGGMLGEVSATTP